MEVERLEVRRRVVLNVGEPRVVELTLVGCGGTGSFLALHLGRLAWHAREQHGIEMRMTFVDPDVVEHKNVGRQNFVAAEVGWPKAEALARRYGLGFGLGIRFFNEALKPEHVEQGRRYRDGWLHMVVGCVDNVAARRGILDICKGWNDRLWWMDCGNHDQSGQVVLGNGETVEMSPLGFCVGLPWPGVRHPELVRKSGNRGIRESGNGDTGMGDCAVDALMDAQSLMVNQAAAGWAASYVYRLVVARDVDCWGTYFDLGAGSARSEYISSQ